MALLYGDDGALWLAHCRSLLRRAPDGDWTSIPVPHDSDSVALSDHPTLGLHRIDCRATEQSAEINASTRPSAELRSSSLVLCSVNRQKKHDHTDYGEKPVTNLSWGLPSHFYGLEEGDHESPPPLKSEHQIH